MNNIKSWLEYLASLNPNKIDLGLERVEKVYQRLNLNKIAPKVIVVAGTNGKGSTINYLESILLAADYRVAKYTSPHIFKFNERIVFNKKPITDAFLIEAFEKIKDIQQQDYLTYFEFTTLAAFYCIAQQKVDVALLEVGLGGRLDAVNIVKRDMNLLTNVELDHEAWLGDTREKIAAEKIAIAKNQVPFYCSDSNPTNAVMQLNRQKDFEFKLINQDFKFVANCFIDVGDKQLIEKLPTMQHQKNNLSLALVAINKLTKMGFSINNKQINAGIHQSATFARQSLLCINGRQVLVDVAHNIASVKALAHFLVQQSFKNCHAVFSISDDKNVDEVIQQIKGSISYWHGAPYKNPRSIKIQKLDKVMAQNSLKYQLYNTVNEAFNTALQIAKAEDLIVVFGSFFVIDELKQALLIENSDA